MKSSLDFPANAIIATRVGHDKLPVSEAMQVRKLIYQDALARLSITQYTANRLWTLESSLLDIGANMVLGSRVREVSSQDELRNYFFSYSPSAPEVLDAAFVAGADATVSFIEAFIERGLIADPGDYELRGLEYTLDSTRMLIIDKLIQRQDDQFTMVYRKE